MTIIRAGLLHQSFGRGSGTCDGASAPGTLTFSSSGLQVGEHMEAASKELAGDRHGGDVLATAGRGLASNEANGGRVLARWAASWSTNRTHGEPIL